MATVDVKMEEMEEETMTAEQWLKLGEETAAVEPKKSARRRWKHDEFIISGKKMDKKSASDIMWHQEAEDRIA